MAAFHGENTLPMEETIVSKEVVLVDLDCFHCQVMTKDLNELKEKPVVVINSMKKIVAVNYEARHFGVKRNDGLHSARQKCPELITVPIPNRWPGKPDQRLTRIASYEIFDSIKKFFENNRCVKLEYSSNDEFYIDLTEMITQTLAKNPTVNEFYPKTILEGCKKVSRNSCDFEKVVRDMSIAQPEEFRLLHAAVITGQLLNFILEQTGYQASAGIAHNKLYAKLACGHNKPKAVTVFLNEGLLRVSKEIAIKDIPKLGGKKGDSITREFFIGEEQPVKTMYDLTQIPTQTLIEKFGEKDGKEFSRLANGVDPSVVVNKSCRAAIQCGRKIQAKIKNLAQLKKILEDTSEELMERLEEEKLRNKRRPGQIKVKVSRTRCAEGELPAIESGEFKCHQNLKDKKELFDRSMEVLETNWEKKGQGPLEQITAINITAARFVTLSE